MKKRTWILLFCLFAATAGAADDADRYTVQKGDNLWLLSNKFLSDPFKWIDLWKLNPDVRDPHWIYPGLDLRLPFKKAGREKKEGPVRSGDAVAEQIPPVSLPEEVEERIIFEETAKEVAVREDVAPKVKKYILDIPMIERLAVYADKKITGVSTVLSAYEKLTLGQLGTRFFVEGGELKGLRRNDTYAVLRLSKEIRDDKTGNLMGYLYSRVGMMLVEEVYPQKALARIVRSYTEVTVGDILAPVGEKDNPEIVVKKSSTFLEGRILEIQDNDVFIGERSFVFIDKGRSEGVERGDVLRIERQSGEFTEKYIDIGKMVVVKTWDSVSAAYILEVKDAAGPGYRFSTFTDNTERN